MLLVKCCCLLYEILDNQESVPAVAEIVLGDCVIAVHEFIVLPEESEIFERLLDALPDCPGVRAVFDFGDEVVLVAVRVSDFKDDDVGPAGVCLELSVVEVVVRDVEAGGVYFLGSR